jgi:uncharacterized membrane protein (UPF0182 family)
LLKLKAAVYGLYHMTDPQVFYNREDLWTVASEVGMDESGQQKKQEMETSGLPVTREQYWEMGLPIGWEGFHSK